MYQKEIIYMGLYKEGSKIGNAGFLKVENREKESRLDLKLRNIPPNIKGRFPIRIHNGIDWQEMNGISVQEGSGSWEENMDSDVRKVQIQIILPGGYFLEGKSKNAPEVPVRSESGVINEPVIVKEAEDEDETEKDILQNDKTIIVTEELHRPVQTESADPENDLPELPQVYNLKEDKWEQILDSYEKIHPYGDERVYVKLEPKDFIILQSKYQHLVNNSFLLHGFYNYRYIILGKENDYYLGVPGVFYEREKMVALMFGFEAFECPGGIAKAGEFGYYLRKVEL